MFGLMSITAFAEASFDEIQGLINSKNYAAAEAGLEVIIKNHPQSAKAFYAMAEAQAGLGNLDKAQKALNLAKGIDPTLKFVSEGSVRSLEQAITPQTAKITYEEPKPTKVSNTKPVMQGGRLNYLGKQKTVTAPVKWKSGPTHPVTHLAYITDEEQKILVDLNIYKSMNKYVSKYIYKCL